MSILGQLIDVIYPPRCYICQRFIWSDGVETRERPLGFCRTCFNDFSELTSPRCPLCSRPFDPEMKEDHVCEGCLRKRPLYNLLGAPYIYEGALVTAIHRFKYGGKSHLAKALGPLLAAFAKEWLSGADDLKIMPVPLHFKKLRERGFNQSLLLAKEVASGLDSELDFLSLRRVKHTQPQTSLTGKERKKNVRRAFGVIDRSAVKGRTIVLVDDVATTGHTLNECALALKRSGAEAVFCLVAARAAVG